MKHIPNIELQSAEEIKSFSGREDKRITGLPISAFPLLQATF